MTASLTALDSGQVFALGDFTLLGRGDDATIRLADQEVSRLHASVRRDGALYWLVDLGSANGSYVNDAALTAPRILQPGDRLQFGRSVLRFDQLEPAAPRFDHIGAAPGGTVISTKTDTPFRGPAAFESRPVTLLVGDLRGFTGLSVLLGPTTIASLLSEWYADCTAVMNAHGAAIDKFIGDCVFAYWPGTGVDVRQRALRAALALRAAEDGAASSPERTKVRAAHGIVLDCRIGLHVGEAAIGALGRGVNTALGDAVNLAFRIERLTRRLATPILVSADFVDGYPDRDQHFRSCGTQEIEGLSTSVEVFELR